MILLKINAYKNYSLNKMEGSDFSFVKDFLDTQKNRLEKTEFFYPYQNDELLSVLEQGIFWGLFDKDRLIATFAIDIDEGYAERLADIIYSCCGKEIVKKAYESSGLMVDEEYRGQGIAKYLMSLAVEEAKARQINICGVVHTLNVASMRTFFSLGFQLRGVWKWQEGYDFVYLLKCFGEVCEEYDLIEKLVLQKDGKCDIIKKEEEYSPLDRSIIHKELLADGYVGITCDNTRICFIRNNKEKNYE